MAQDRIYVGNLPYDRCNDTSLRELFRGYDVAGTHVITDPESGRPRGYCFVQMGSAEAAENAVEALDGAEVGGRTIVVNLAKDKNSGGGRGGGGGGRERRGGSGGGRERRRGRDDFEAGWRN